MLVCTCRAPPPLPLLFHLLFPPQHLFIESRLVLSFSFYLPLYLSFSLYFSLSFFPSLSLFSLSLSLPLCESIYVSCLPLALTLRCTFTTTQISAQKGQNILPHPIGSLLFPPSRPMYIERGLKKKILFQAAILMQSHTNTYTGKVINRHFCIRDFIYTRNTIENSVYPFS